jgi:hypothetical protein
VDGLLRKVRLNRRWLGLKKFQNNGVLKWIVWKLFRPAHLFLITSCRPKQPNNF